MVAVVVEMIAVVVLVLVYVVPVLWDVLAVVFIAVVSMALAVLVVLVLVWRIPPPLPAHPMIFIFRGLPLFCGCIYFGFLSDHRCHRCAGCKRRLP